MARKPINYWEIRSTELMKRIEKRTENTINSLIKAYEQATKDINKEITKIFKNYAKDTGLKKEDLLQLLTKKETEQYYNNLLEVINNNITDEGIKKKLLAKYNAPAYSYRISRYEALQQNIDVELKKLANIEQQITEIRYVDTIKEGYYYTIFDIQKGTGIGFSFAKIDNRTINLLLNENWIDNANFSQRIWKNSEKLGSYLRTQLTAASLSGKSINKIAQELSEYMNVGLYNATRLVRTEVNHFANEAEILSYEELDIEKYRFIATLDNRTCEHCAELDNKVFNIKDRKAGKNCPPIHANDRCTTVAVFDDDNIENLQRKARDENGKPILVPRDMTYKEWDSKYVDKEEGIIDNLFNKNSKTKLKNITEQKNNIINQAFVNNNIKNIAMNTNIKSIKLGGNKSYHQKGKIVLKTNYNSHTVRHELAHAVDYNNKWLSSTNSFIKAIELDKKNILNNQSLYKNLIKNNSKYRELSDIMSGMTNNQIKGRYFHKNSYWKKANKLEKEVFAQMFTVAGANDFRQLQIFKKYLPNTFKAFDDLIGRLL
jgi:SPP1 gp7 family putative phage head morphogenesis protein